MALQKINTDLISADAVTAAKIADGAITADDIGANNITGAKIASNSILTRHIDDDQVTGDQLADAITVVTSVTSPLLVASTSARVTQVALTSTSNAVAWDAAAAAECISSYYRKYNLCCTKQCNRRSNYTSRNCTRWNTLYSCMEHSL
jgi:hypothetical protein